MAADETDQVARLFHAVWHETQSHLQDPRRGRFRDLAFFQNRVSERSARTIVASSQPDILGFACWTGTELNSLFVASSARCLGLGSVLLEAAESAMRSAGATHLSLDCLVGNQLARRFYERHGWQVTGERNWEDETPEGPAWAKSWTMVKP
ncbi:MAG: GNAT family N-acetyltransferase [Alphaproteobacteria bacterium]|nr:GNAT family N-acetyltransferase [Alphaproteobacteria bacterium]